MIFAVEKRLQFSNCTQFIDAVHRNPEVTSIIIATLDSSSRLDSGPDSNLFGAYIKGALLIVPLCFLPPTPPIAKNRSITVSINWTLCQDFHQLDLKLLHHYHVTSLIILTTLWCTELIHSFESYQGTFSNCQYLKPFLSIWCYYHLFASSQSTPKLNMKKLKFFRPISVSIR